MRNVPDDWENYYFHCNYCDNSYHASEGGCGCTEDMVRCHNRDNHPDVRDSLVYYDEAVEIDGKNYCQPCANEMKIMDLTDAEGKALDIQRMREAIQAEGWVQDAQVAWILRSANSEAEHLAELLEIAGRKPSAEELRHLMEELEIGISHTDEAVLGRRLYQIQDPHYFC